MNILKRFIDWLFEDCHRLDCKCCGKDLHKPGGHVVIFIGPGFCSKCFIELNKTVK